LKTLIFLGWPRFERKYSRVWCMLHLPALTSICLLLSKKKALDLNWSNTLVTLQSYLWNTQTKQWFFLIWQPFFDPTVFMVHILCHFSVKSITNNKSITESLKKCNANLLFISVCQIFTKSNIFKNIVDFHYSLKSSTMGEFNSI
jgi:hypothetical protein